MRSFRSFASVPEGGFARPTAVTIGKFDGVHLGHQQVLARLRQIAEREGLEPVVFTFTENPLARLRPEVCPPPLTSPEQRLELLEKAGIAATLMVDFTPELQALEPCEFVQKVLVETLQARHLLVGQDFRFGARGAGDVAVLRELGEKFGFTVSVIDDVLCDGAEAGFGNGSGGGPEMTGNGCEDNSCESAEKGVPERISSSRIRALIAAGNVEKAGKLLGRPVTVRGIVAHGAARGRDLGFPTANLAPGFDGRAPQEGVYAGIAQLG
ncbi:MAG: bifunctional riboflavin kinase/FMN adenylyltransferase, partial [Microbacteriaceae bacterium]|nr:bifunctional riboflavin kinase/FMN adenylyltransferase [Microbacteriaceae bacterium]